MYILLKYENVLFKGLMFNLGIHHFHLVVALVEHRLLPNLRPTGGNVPHTSLVECRLVMIEKEGILWKSKAQYTL